MTTSFAIRHAARPAGKPVRMLCLLFLCLCLMAAAASAQSIRMAEGAAAFEYPDDWLVLSPQLCHVYEPVLSEMGQDAAQLASTMENEHILSCAYNADFSQRLAVIVWAEESSQRLFDISQADVAGRRQIRSRMENGSLWETTGYRARDTEWQTVFDRYWLYVHYLITFGGETIGRGLRYLTVHNGQYVALDWQISNGRFSNRDLASFKTRLQGFVFTMDEAEPMHEVTLEAELPTETSSGRIEISGTASPGATVTLSIEYEDRGLVVAAETDAGARGSFTLKTTLEEEGESELILSAHADGMIDVSRQGWITYNSKTLPVSGLEANLTTSEDTVTISGKTLPGTSLQLVTPFGLTKKNSANDGSFSFELTTKEEGTYEYTLLLEKKGYVQRRFPFTIVRIITDDQQKAEIRKSAVKINYRDLQKDLEKNQGQVMNLYGPVSEVSTGGGQTYIRMQFSKTSGGKWYNPVILVTDSDPGVPVGSFISAVVSVDGVYVEQDDAGKDVNVPRMRLLFIDRIE